jgi:hypothetical protein
MLGWINIPTVLILNIDCLVLMGTIVNFNKINFILLFHCFIIILHGALGMPLFYIIRCHIRYLVGIAAFSLTSLFNCLKHTTQVILQVAILLYTHKFIYFYFICVYHFCIFLKSLFCAISHHSYCLPLGRHCYDKLTETPNSLPQVLNCFNFFSL